MIQFRDLKADDVECRVQQIKQNGLSLLLYKNARVDMAILDECVGPENWQREHYEVKDSLFCRVGINVPNVVNGDLQWQWVWKSDCGTESNADAQKGEASDSFKRACVNWGIGRELYTAPFIWIPSSKCNIEVSPRKDQYGRDTYSCRDKFIVKEINVVNKTIVSLHIYNATRKEICFTYQSSNAPDKGSFDTDDFFQAAVNRSKQKGEQ